MIPKNTAENPPNEMKKTLQSEKTVEEKGKYITHAHKEKQLDVKDYQCYIKKNKELKNIQKYQ